MYVWDLRKLMLVVFLYFSEVDRNVAVSVITRLLVEETKSMPDFMGHDAELQSK